MAADASVERLRKTLADAEAVIYAGGRDMTIVSTPRAMRALGLRGRVICEHFDGRKAYSVSARRVVEQVRLAIGMLS